MSKFKTEFYNSPSGVLFTLSWSDEQEYRLAKAFLQKLVGDPIGRNDFHPDKPELYHLETEQQRDAVFDFRRGLRQKR